MPARKLIYPQEYIIPKQYSICHASRVWPFKSNGNRTVIGDTAESSDENNLMPLRPAYDLPVFNRHTIFLFAWHLLRVQYRLPCIHPGRIQERAGTQDGFSHPIFYHALHTCRSEERRVGKEYR